jgi:2-iminobutanoate/2-iminopropanoate deaminase
MTIEHFEQPWGNPGSYSQCVRAGGDLIVTCGQAGADVGAEPVAFERQAQTALERMLASVRAAGGAPEHVIKVNAYLRTLDDFPAFDAVYRRVMAVEPKPARTTVEITRFPAPLLVEVDCWAVVPR